MARTTIVAIAYLLVHACDAVDLLEDTVCAMQMAVLRTEAAPDDPCKDQAKMPAAWAVVTNNLGGKGPDTRGPPVIHVSPFLELPDGTSVDLTVSNLSEYTPKKVSNNGPDGEFFNLNLAPSFVELQFAFTDTNTGAGVTLPPWNLTIYDIDGPEKEHSKNVSFAKSDIVGYRLTETTDVAVRVEPTVDRIVFESTAFGELCDNPDSIENLAVVQCAKSGTVNQKDRSVAVTLKGGVPGYHVTLRARQRANHGRNFLLGVPAYFDKVCKAGTPSPTSAPIPAPTSAPTGATSFGDPHVSNLRGQRFEILQPDYHTFLMIPRGSEAKRALLHVLAKVEPFGLVCNGLLYVTGLVFQGHWLGDALRLEFSTRVDADMDAQRAIKIKMSNSSDLDVPQFIASVPPSLAQVTIPRPNKPEFLNQHVTTMQVKLQLGPCTSKVWMVYQKEQGRFTNSFWLMTTGLAQVTEEIGGILGHDDHEYAASRPEECSGSEFLRDVRHTAIHALALLEDEEES